MSTATMSTATMSTDNRAVYRVVGGSGGIGAVVVRQLTANGARGVVISADGGPGSVQARGV